MRTLKSGLLSFLIMTMLTSCSTLSNPDIEKLNMKANELVEKGDVDGAIARLISINDLNPAFAPTHYNLGIAYYKKGSYEKAVDELNQAIKLKPNFADAFYTLGVVYEDWTLKFIEENNGKNLSPEIKAAIILNTSKSIEAYKNYLKLTPNASDANEIRTKIEYLKSDIKKYSEDELQ